MSIKDFIGMRIKFKKFNGADTSEGTVVDCHMKVSLNSNGKRKEIERFVIMEDDGNMTISDWDNIYRCSIAGEASINTVKQRLSSTDTLEEIPRTHLIDMED